MQVLVVNNKSHTVYMDVSGTGDLAQTYAIGPKAKEIINIPDNRYAQIQKDYQNQLSIKKHGGEQ